jgi:hydrogenase maturation protease
LGADSLGPRVYAALATASLPPGLEVIDGGLAGLDLLRFVGADRLVFVDSLQGFGAPGELIVWGAPDLARNLPADPASARYDHAAGLAYLLRVILKLYPECFAQLWLVGQESRGQPPAETDVEQVVGACLRLVREEQARC